MRSRRVGIGPLATIAFGIGFGLWTALLNAGRLAGLDAFLAPAPRWLDPATQVAAAVAIVFHPLLVCVVLTGIAVWAFRRRLRNLTLGIALAMLLGPGVDEVLRRVFARPRPPGALAELISNQGYSYPSGHLVAIVTAALVSIAATTTTKQARPLIEFWRWLGVALILLVAVDRWLLHAHWISDLVGGALFGGFATSLALTVARVDMQPVPPTQAAALAARTPKRCAIVVNPTKIPDWAAFRRHIESDCRESGWTPTFLETTADDPGRGMAQRALAAGADLVLVAGGDGTVRVVCAELAGTGVPLGLLPSGTGNLLARNLGIPLDESEAIQVALQGWRRNIDLVEVLVDDADQPELVAAMAGLGLDARIMSATDDGLKKLIGPAAYVVAAGGAATLPSFDVTISLDGGEPIQRRAGVAMIANIGALQGNVQLLPDARFDDGLLDLLVASPSNTADWLRITTSLLLPMPEASGIDRGQGREVLIETPEPVAYQLDGDVAGECRRLHARVTPGVLAVMVPELG